MSKGKIRIWEGFAFNTRAPFVTANLVKVINFKPKKCE